MQDGRHGGPRRPTNGTNGAHSRSSHVRPVPFDEVAGDPIDLVAVQADDELINALAAGMAVSSPGRGGYDADDQVAALLAAWKAEVDEEPLPELVDVDTAVARVQAATRPSTTRRLRLVAPVAAAAVLVLSVAGVGTAASTARPGDGFAWDIAQVVDSERAESLLAAGRVEERIAEAKAALTRGEPEVAAQVLAAAEDDLVAVRAEEGAAALAEVQSFLEAKAAETPPGQPTQPGAPLARDPDRPVPPGAVTEAPVVVPTSPEATLAPTAPSTSVVVPPASPTPAAPTPSPADPTVPDEETPGGSTSETPPPTAEGISDSQTATEETPSASAGAPSETEPTT